MNLISVCAIPTAGWRGVKLLGSGSVETYSLERWITLHCLGSDWTAFKGMPADPNSPEFIVPSVKLGGGGVMGCFNFSSGLVLKRS